MKKLKLPAVELILVIGLAYVFIFFGLQKIFQPIYWIGWTPNWMEGLLGLSKEVWTNILGGVELIFGLGLLIPKTKTIFAVVIALHLLAVVFVTRFSDIGVRDTGLLLMSLAILSARLKQ